MKVEHHLRKMENFSSTLKKLNYDEDYETMIEDFLLYAAHLVNAAMHKQGTLPEDKDIKHNKLFGFLKSENPLGNDSEKVADLMQQLEQLRPSHVYGKGENGETARKAEEIFKEIKNICSKLMEGKNERES